MELMRLERARRQNLCRRGGKKVFSHAGNWRANHPSGGNDLGEMPNAEHCSRHRSCVPQTGRTDRRDRRRRCVRRWGAVEHLVRCLYGIGRTVLSTFAIVNRSPESRQTSSNPGSCIGLDRVENRVAGSVRLLDRDHPDGNYARGSRQLDSAQSTSAFEDRLSHCDGICFVE